MDQPAGGGVAAAVVARRAEIAQAFAAAQPFRHVVIDDFLDPALADALLAQFPPLDRADSRGEDGKPGAKATCERIRALGPAYARLDDLLRSDDFRRLLGELTGIDGLLYDPWYLGGGTHENRAGARLEAHVDFNFHPLERWRRRINLILYLNPEWDAAWGGALDLYRDPRSDATPSRSVLPRFNRCVLFETHDRSWHGFGPVTPPADRPQLSRRSIALYFYTRAGAGDDAPEQSHSTVYVSRGLPAQLQVGHVLDADDMRALQEMVAEKDGRIAMQYAEIGRLMTLVRAQERGVTGALLYLARKGWARLRRRPQ
jgi:hypothetical protein